MPDRNLEAAPGVKLTYDDFLHFPDDGLRHELIDGVHYVTPSANVGHQRIAGNLHGWIWTYLRQHPIGEVFIAPFDVIFSRFNVVEPDLLYVSNARSSIVEEANVKGAPDLVVEIESPSTRRRDLGVKLRLYAASEVHEYWVFSPKTQTVRVYRRRDDNFADPILLKRDEDDGLETTLLPGLRIPLREIFGARR